MAIGRHGDSGELAETLGAERARFLIELADEEGLEPRLPYAPDDPDDRLTASGLGIDDAAGVVGADKAAEAHQSEIRVDRTSAKTAAKLKTVFGPFRLFDRIVVPVADERGQPVARPQLDIGAKPGDLPVEQPTKFELVINLKTAQAPLPDCW